MLGNVYDARAVESLVTALKDQDSVVRGEAVEALGKIGAVEPLVAVLEGEDSYLAHTAAEALGKIGDERAVVPLIAVLKGHGYLMARAAAEALGQIGDARAVKPLLALRDEKEILPDESYRGDPYLEDNWWQRDPNEVLREEQADAQQGAATALQMIRSKQVHE